MSMNCHLNDPEWLKTKKGDPRGYIDVDQLKELWFHTGTTCNLSCPFCLEGSKPGDDRLQTISLEDAKPYLDEAFDLGVERFSFTGGEPFVNREMLKILDYALELRPCLVLTNGTKPLELKLSEVGELKHKKNPLSFRISLDYPDAEQHDENRGKGNFDKALQVCKKLREMGFEVSIARQGEAKEDMELENNKYRQVFQNYQIPEDLNIVVFPDFLPPGSQAEVPEITESCMTTYQSEETRSKFMCRFSRMMVKINHSMRVYACTLVDDDRDYDLGSSLKDSLQTRVMLRHHRCFSCFSFGASCS